MRTFEYPRTLALPPPPAFARTRPGATTVVVVVVLARLAYASAYPGSSIVLKNATTTSTHAQSVPIGENGARARTVPPLTYADDADMLARRRMRPTRLVVMVRLWRVRTFGAGPFCKSCAYHSRASAAASARAAPHTARARAMATSSACVTKECIFTLALHPSALVDPLVGARRVLDGMMMKHSPALGGVLMAYEDERLCGEDGDASDGSASSESTSMRDDVVRERFGVVLHASGYVDVAVRCACRVFHPARGSRLVGVVNKCSHDFIGALVLDVFNVAISQENIREELVSCPEEGSWKSAWDDAHALRVGSHVVFTVKDITESDDVVLLVGAMEEEGTGEREYVARSSSGITSIERKLLKRSEPKAKKEKKEKKDKADKKKEKKEKKEKRSKRDGEDDGDNAVDAKRAKVK